MYSFNNDYSETAHLAILRAILNSKEEQNNGYGLDVHCENAKKLIENRIGRKDADIHFMPGGTITNATLIAHTLKPFEAVIAADSGHINVHETGAIEATGHKVISLPCKDGKLTPLQIEKTLEEHTDEHMVLPKMVYISNPTEIGTIYKKKEIEELASFCRKKGLYLYLDGARLAMALTAVGADFTMKDLAENTDAFYIGGTKAGALFGEALIILNPSIKENFRFSMKQHGAMTAKGWIIGVQFEELFRENLYEDLGRHANEMAELLREAFCKAKFSLYSDSPTNQVFAVIPDTLLAELDKEYITLHWGKEDTEHTIVRFCTSFATKEEEIRKFITYLMQAMNC